MNIKGKRQSSLGEILTQQRLASTVDTRPLLPYIFILPDSRLAEALEQVGPAEQLYRHWVVVTEASCPWHA